MLTDGGVKVVDFGISAIEGEAEGTQLIGTPAYLSPERLAGAPAQPATDIYCLGVLLCQLLTGLPPIEGELAAGVSGLPPALPPLIRRCLVADPQGRPTARELAERLRSAGGAGTRLAPPRPPDLTRPVHAPGPAAHPKPSPHPRPAPAARPKAANVGPRPRPPRPAPAVGPQGTRVLPPPPPPPVLVTIGPPRIVPPPPTRPRRRTWLVALLAFLGILVLGCGALLANQDKDKGKPDAAQAAVSRSPAAPPSPKVVCAAQYKITSDWKIGFLATVTVDIQGTDDVTGWRVEFDFPGNQGIDSGWPGKYTQDGQHVTIRNDNWNAVLVAGKSYSSGLLGHYTGSNAKPKKITLNGVTCADKGGD
jgi:serine/threonine-protein kinase